MQVFTYKDYLEYQEKVKISSMLKETQEQYSYEDEPIYKKHDKLIKTILNRREVSKILERYLSISILEEDLEEWHNTYITKNYKERESDIVYKIKGRRIFFLIEHQSTIDYRMPFRILEYSVEIMRQVIQNDKKDLKYPQIIPIVIYTGNVKWDEQINMKKMQERLEGYKQEDFKYNLIDINCYTKEELLKDGSMFSKIAILEKYNSVKEIIEVLNSIIKHTKEQKEKEEIYRIVNYIVRQKIGNEETEKILEKIKKGEDENMVLEVFAKEYEKAFKER